MEENLIQINGGIMINIDVSVENVMYVKNIMFRILFHIAVNMENIQQVLWMFQQLRVMKLKSHTTKKQKLSQKNLIKRKQPSKHKYSIF